MSREAPFIFHLAVCAQRFFFSCFHDKKDFQYWKFNNIFLLESKRDLTLPYSVKLVYQP